VIPIKNLYTMNMELKNIQIINNMKLIKKKKVKKEKKLQISI